MIELIAPEQKRAGLAGGGSASSVRYLFAGYLRASLEPISSFIEDLPEKRESGSVTARSIAEASDENNQYFLPAKVSPSCVGAATMRVRAGEPLIFPVSALSCRPGGPQTKNGA
jgi:hypothetical protein